MNLTTVKRFIFRANEKLQLSFLFMCTAHILPRLEHIFVRILINKPVITGHSQSRLKRKCLVKFIITFQAGFPTMHIHYTYDTCDSFQRTAQTSSSVNRVTYNMSLKKKCPVYRSLSRHHKQKLDRRYDERDMYL